MYIYLGVLLLIVVQSYLGADVYLFMCAFMNCCTIISRCRCIFIYVCFYELLYNHI